MYGIGSNVSPFVHLESVGTWQCMKSNSDNTAESANYMSTRDNHVV